MADAHPEHEVHDGPSPRDGNVESPDTNTLPHQVSHAHAEQDEQRDRYRKQDVPAARRLGLERPRNRFGNGVQGLLPENQGHAAVDRILQFD